MFLLQSGGNKHEHICEALELFATDVMPEFRAREIAREKHKQEELAPSIEKAMAPKWAMPPMRSGTERQKQNVRLWADAARVTLSEPLSQSHRKTIGMDF